jgi:hypothetical protein
VLCDWGFCVVVVCTILLEAEAFHQKPDVNVSIVKQWWTSWCGVEILVCEKDGKWDLCNPLQKRFSLGNWTLQVRVIPTTPSLNYWSSFNVDLHGHTIACCKLQVVTMQRSLSIVMIKFQLISILFFCNPYIQHTSMYAIEGVAR